MVILSRVFFEFSSSRATLATATRKSEPRNWETASCVDFKTATALNRLEIRIFFSDRKLEKGLATVIIIVISRRGANLELVRSDFVVQPLLGRD